MVVIDEHDIGKTEAQLLMDLIYESAGFRVPEHAIKYGKPEVLDARPEVMTDPNTYIPITVDSSHDKTLSGLNRGVMYRRRDILKHVCTLDLDLEFTTWPTTLGQVIIDHLNPQLDYPLRMTDFEDYEITDENTDRIIIKAAEHSLFWTGSATLNITPPGQEYFVLVENPFLEGFTQWQP